MVVAEGVILYWYVHPSGCEVRIFAESCKDAYAALASMVRTEFADTILDDWERRSIRKHGRCACTCGNCTNRK
jgi:hypothetical protein